MKTKLCEDGLERCSWCTGSKLYMDYHDSEWGFPVYDDKRLFEKICLEGFQSGLSWNTILIKRENFRKGFRNFDYNKISKFTEEDIERLMQDKGIVRHRGKIEATINNAKMVQPIVNEFGSLANYFWSFKPTVNRGGDEDISTSPESIELAKDLKKRGWKFVGPTTVYAFMQAMGMVNDHAKNCFLRKSV